MPLADKIRPQTLDEVVGQQHLLSKNSLFRRVIESGEIPNMVFFGPSGVGKTTVAEIIAKNTDKTLRKINATNASLSDIKDICAETGSVFTSEGILLYIDEIQYFNKKQQQSLLEFIEDGRITLICSTTENPYFAIYPAILSRSNVFEFKSVDKRDVRKALDRAYGIIRSSYMTEEEAPESEKDAALDLIASSCIGDVRRAIGALELCFTGTAGIITEKAAREAIGDFALKLDRDGNEHYDLLSALQKSIRGSDENAALFYLARLLEAGDLLSPCRRLLVIASEDVGLAYPMAAVIVNSLIENAKQLGLPEARIPLAEAVVLLATAPKSNSSYMAYDAAAEDVRSGKGMKMPDYLRDSMQPSADKNRGYIYPHTYPKHYVNQQYLPDDIADRKYYVFGDNKTEQSAAEYREMIKRYADGFVKKKNESK